MNATAYETFPSVTGQPLQKRVWQPEGEPRAIVQLLHGMAEHIGRYAETAQSLCAAGFLVVGHTHLGHGEGAELLGHFAKTNGWDALIDDAHALRTAMTARCPGVPYFLLGHSMGSFVARTYCLKYEKGLAGVILSGTGHFEPAMVGSGLFLASLQCALGMAEKPGRLLSRISTAGYNKKYENPRTEFDWLSTEESVVDAYIADPYCGFPFTVRAYRDMFTGLARLYPPSLAAMEKDVPVYLFAGDQDPVGQYGRGVEQTAGELRAAGVKNVTVRLYPGGRHEMFNEKDRRMVWDDLIAWLEGVLEGR